MKPLLVAVGLPELVVDHVRKTVDARIVSYPGLARAYSANGRFFIESQNVAGKWLCPDAVLFYGYFEDAHDFRMALALSRIPTYPDVGKTILHDDRAQSLLLCLQEEGSIGRGYLPKNFEFQPSHETVAKWSNRHCGDDKARFTESWTAPESALVEPFVAGQSERILLVENEAYRLGYESQDWRKNVNASVRRLPVNEALERRARKLAQGLGLELAGIDFVVNDDGEATLLEVNAYPGFEDIAEAETAFARAIETWARKTLDLQ